MNDNCLICGESLAVGDVVNVNKGRTTLVEASQGRGDGLSIHMETKSPLRLHTTCRKNYSRPSSIQACASKTAGDSRSHENSEADTSRLCSSLRAFDFKVDCLFCGKEASMRVETKKETKYRKTICEVRTITFRDRIRCRAIERNDEWGEAVMRRVDSAIDLVASGGKYHKTCNLEFFRNTEDINKKKPSHAWPTRRFNKSCWRTT